MNWTWLLPMSIILPISGAALTLVASRRPRVQRTISVTVVSIQLLVELVMITQVTQNGPMVMHIGGWTAPLGITLVADELAAFMLVVSTVVSLAVLVYGISQGMADREVGPEVPISIFHPTFLILITGVSNAFVAGDLFNLFVSFEILLTASFVLLTTGGTRERLRAGAPYIVVSLLSSLIFLSGIAMVYAATGTVNLADLSTKIPALPAGIVATLQALLLVAFGIKAAVFPMSAWLPDSYPSAPAPVTAVFAGLLTKVGIYAIIRVQTLLFPTGSFATLLMIAALATMIVGILGAISQSGIKRMLSFTLVSHIGYMLFGVALGSETGLSAAIYYVAHHILVQTALFLAVGLVERVAGTTVLARLGGLAGAAPMLAVLFFIPAMNLAGVPPLSGFLGKVGLFEAGVQDGRVLAYVLVAGGALTSLLTLYAIIRVWGRAFWRPVPEAVPIGGDPVETESGRSLLPRRRVHREAQRRLAAQETARLPVGMVGATTAIVAVGLLLTVAAGPIYDVAARAGASLSDRSVYVNAVLGAGVPAPPGAVSTPTPTPAPSPGTGAGG
ncbi:Na+/H+ antiporter subunit D [Nakamurella sp.]|uniref:Na+/H+ antiporter subunit D n=1 Tax=Nakamurella sp. TaxID=1869182 RepID=UPI003B3B56D7